VILKENPDEQEGLREGNAAQFREAEEGAAQC